MAKHKSWVAYYDGIEAVKIVRRKVNAKHLTRPCEEPVLVEDEDGERYVVPLANLYDNPMEADLASAKMRKDNGLEDVEEAELDEEADEDDEEEEDDEDDEEEEEDEDDDEEGG